MLPRYLLNFDLTHLQKSYSDFLVVGSGNCRSVCRLEAFAPGSHHPIDQKGTDRKQYRPGGSPPKTPGLACPGGCHPDQRPLCEAFPHHLSKLS